VRAGTAVRGLRLCWGPQGQAGGRTAARLLWRAAGGRLCGIQWIDQGQPSWWTSHACLCNAYARQKFYELYKSQASPIAGEALQRIAQVYQIEAEVLGRPADERLAVRQAKTQPILAQMQSWLEARLAEVSGKSKIAEAIRYMLSHWDGLTIFLADGRVEVDNYC